MDVSGLRRHSPSSGTTGERGSAHRMALDHPDRVTKLAVLDIVPTRHVFATVGKELATAYYHWFFFIQPYDLPETLIGADPVYYLRKKLGGWGTSLDTFAPEALAEYERCFDAGHHPRELRGLPRRRLHRPRPRRSRLGRGPQGRVSTARPLGRPGVMETPLRRGGVWREYADRCKGQAHRRRAFPRRGEAGETARELTLLPRREECLASSLRGVEAVGRFQRGKRIRPTDGICLPPENRI